MLNSPETGNSVVSPNNSEQTFSPFTYATLDTLNLKVL